jgi:transcription initiation factor TFIID subunit 1
LSTFCSKEIANFHRPRAKWYPHENKIASQLQGPACSHGRMAVLLMSLGGKGVKILVNAEDTPVSVKLKASKKFGWYPFTTLIVFVFFFIWNFLLSYLLFIDQLFAS